MPAYEIETEQRLTSNQTHYRSSLSGTVFYGSNDPTNSVKALMEDNTKLKQIQHYIIKNIK